MSGGGSVERKIQTGLISNLPVVAQILFRDLQQKKKKKEKKRFQLVKMPFKIWGYETLTTYNIGNTRHCGQFRYTFFFFQIYNSSDIHFACAALPRS